ncbi:PTS system, cellobiose-specific IIC component [Seinonella peptonophila]|uniref:Permease IIC component n=1 Tax=Seinonella peptonophila TaxID=112248 RepID=A0A1M5A8E3_9BACL|nr:PTS transporter subunit EIIC [Seinonella peptonophila]SHF26397.1 PTS system, cellobiose-specific IIC component [Seinonella peptonophila]
MSQPTKLNGIIQFLERYFAPIAAKVEKQRYISSIKNGMIGLMAVLMIGSFSLIIMAIGNMFPEGSSIRIFFDQNHDLINLPFQFTFGLLSIYAAISIAYNHARQLKIPFLHSIIGATIATLIFNVKIVKGALDTSFLDSKGLFIAIIVSLLTVELMAFFIKRKITIRFKGLPDGIAQTFEALIPLFTVLLASVLINGLVLGLTGGKNLPEAFTHFLAPTFDSIDTPYAIWLISFLEMLFWFIGLNGYAILVGFVLPFMTKYLGENAAAFAARQPIPHVFAPNFWDYFLGCTGSGVTGAIVILALFSKSKELRTIGKASSVPAIFTISEPVVFGLPIVYNPYLFIPFVFGTPTLGVLTYYVFKFGWVRAPIANVGGIPVPIAQYLSTMDWRAIILTIAIIAAGVLMYYPFFKMYERSLLAKAKEKDQRQRDFDQLDLDF